MTRIDRLLARATDRIGGDSPRLDAEILLAHALGKPRSFLYAWPEHEPTPTETERFEQWVRRRAAGEPVAHLTGEREFWSLLLAVTPDVLIPRPDTELLVETALDCLDDDHAHVLELGTGSGAIAIALATERPHWRLLATDIRPEALAIAATNAKRHHCGNLRFAQGDWFDAVPNDSRFDLIVSNPPYIADDDPHLGQGDVRFEPRTALTAGPAGLDAIRQIATRARSRLRPGGWLLVEHGADQADAVAALFRHAGLTSIHCRRDLGGRDRVTLGRNTRLPA